MWYEGVRPKESHVATDNYVLIVFFQSRFTFSQTDAYPQKRRVILYFLFSFSSQNKEERVMTSASIGFEIGSSRASVSDNAGGVCGSNPESEGHCRPAVRSLLQDLARGYLSLPEVYLSTLNWGK